MGEDKGGGEVCLIPHFRKGGRGGKFREGKRQGNLVASSFIGDGLGEVG